MPRPLGVPSKGYGTTVRARRERWRVGALAPAAEERHRHLMSMGTREHEVKSQINSTPVLTKVEEVGELC